MWRTYLFHLCVTHAHHDLSNIPPYILCTVYRSLQPAAATSHFCVAVVFLEQSAASFFNFRSHLPVNFFFSFTPLYAYFSLNVSSTSYISFHSTAKIKSKDKEQEEREEEEEEEEVISLLLLAFPMRSEGLHAHRQQQQQQ